MRFSKKKLLALVSVIFFWISAQLLYNHRSIKVSGSVSDTSNSSQNPAKAISFYEKDKSNHKKSQRTFKLVSDQNTTSHSWLDSDTKAPLSKCKDYDWYKFGPLPKVSVILTFIENENASTLLHTVHSIVQRTPESLLHEIVLIADNSKRDDHGEMLDNYVKEVFKIPVIIHRSKSMLGLIGARLLGIRLAKAEVVVVMDSHMEVQPRWLEPLLYVIVQNPKTMAASALDWMEKDETRKWNYRHTSMYWKTFFDWSMGFGWQQMSETQIRTIRTPGDAIDSPITIGGIFAIRKSWFTFIGEFDEGMKLWGGENIDLPVRVWLCGGRVVMVPCSRVAHLEYTHNRAYRSTWATIIDGNYKRFSMVWMDDYIKYFYLYFPHVKDFNVGDISKRLELKKKCPHNFHWYLKNVFPELGSPEEDGYAYGTLMNIETKLCLTIPYADKFQPLELDSCKELPATRNYFFLSKKLELRQQAYVFNAASRSENSIPIVEIKMRQYINVYGELDKVSNWVHLKDGHVLETKLKLCLEALSPKSVQLTHCDGKKDAQKWKFAHYSNEFGNIMNNTHGDLKDIDGLVRGWKDNVISK